MARKRKGNSRAPPPLAGDAPPPLAGDAPPPPAGDAPPPPAGDAPPPPAGDAPPPLAGDAPPPAGDGDAPRLPAGDGLESKAKCKNSSKTKGKKNIKEDETEPPVICPAPSSLRSVEELEFEIKKATDNLKIKEGSLKKAKEILEKAEWAKVTAMHNLRNLKVELENNHLYYGSDGTAGPKFGPKIAGKSPSNKGG